MSLSDAWDELVLFKAMGVLGRAVNANLIKANFNVVMGNHPIGEEKEKRAISDMAKDMGSENGKTLLEYIKGWLQGSSAITGSQYGVLLYSPIKDNFYNATSRKSAAYNALPEAQQNAFQSIRGPLTILHEGAHLDSGQNLTPYFFAMRGYASNDRSLSDQQKQIFSDSNFISNLEESSADAAAVVIAAKLGVIKKEQIQPQLETLIALRLSASDIGHQTAPTLKALQKLDPNDYMSIPNKDVVKFANDLAFKTCLQTFGVQLPPEYSFRSFSGMPLERVRYRIADETEIQKVGQKLDVIPTCIDRENAIDEAGAFGINRKYLESKRQLSNEEPIQKNGQKPHTPPTCIDKKAAIGEAVPFGINRKYLESKRQLSNEEPMTDIPRALSNFK